VGRSTRTAMPETIVAAAAKFESSITSKVEDWTSRKLYDGS
jgi:hypothetical protein